MDGHWFLSREHVKSHPKNHIKEYISPRANDLSGPGRVEEVGEWGAFPIEEAPAGVWWGAVRSGPQPQSDTPWALASISLALRRVKRKHFAPGLGLNRLNDEWRCGPASRM